MTTYKASFLTFARGLAFFFAPALRSQSGLKVSMPRDQCGSFWPMTRPRVTNNICIVIKNKLSNRKANQTTARTVNQTVNRITNKIENRTPNRSTKRRTNKLSNFLLVYQYGLCLIISFIYLLRMKSKVRQILDQEGEYWTARRNPKSSNTGWYTA